MPNGSAPAELTWGCGAPLPCGSGSADTGTRGGGLLSRARKQAVVRVSALGNRKRQRSSGFTFVELMVVITIIVILVTMAIPIYNNTIRRSKESVLKNNLFTLRTVIDNYTYDKQKAPQSLQDLVSDGYLREIPIDPMTGSNQSWRTIMEDASQSVNQSEPGIFDVKSGSDKMGLDGTPYSEW
jgi:general secretion pathway protein G